MKGENRMSRLPPLSSESPLIASRPGFFRSASARDAENIQDDPQSPRFGMRTEIESDTLRPVSVYPRMSKIPSPGPMLNFPHTEDGDDEANRGRKPAGLGNNIILSRTEESPGPIGQLPSGRVEDRSPSLLSSRPSIDSISQQRPYDIRALAPPRSPFSPKIPSLMSADGSDEESSVPIAPSERHNLRKLSSSSGLSTSPISPFIPRSPSVCSDVSASANRLSRPAFNFSRPLSRASEMPVELPLRQASMDSEPFPPKDDTARVPSSLSPIIPASSTQESPAPSTIYSTFALPRGKVPQPGSMTIPQLEQTPSGSNQTDVPHTSPSKANTSPSHANPDSNAEKSTDKSAEWHVTKGIECHENGSLNESTYHLRIAARQNHPTGMLLYALACRHGWGMRANQQEGVQWLRKAADCAILEATEDENSAQGVESIAQKQRKAQFALSMCELGMSHLNGWGIEQDKVLALRCFEIAGGRFPRSINYVYLLT